MPELKAEIGILSAATKAGLEELSKQNYALVEAILREMNRRIELLTKRT